MGDTFDVVLESCGNSNQTVRVIKAVRELTGLGLKEAKSLVERAPATILRGVDKGDAEAAKAKIEAAGGTVTIR